MALTLNNTFNEVLADDTAKNILDQYIGGLYDFPLFFYVGSYKMSELLYNGVFNFYDLGFSKEVIKQIYNTIFIDVEGDDFCENLAIRN